MKKKLAILLCILSLIVSAGAIVSGLVAMCVTDRLVSQSQIVAIETTLRTYADSLDSLRDSIDVTGSQIPVYAMTLKKTATIFQDAQKVADELDKLTTLQVNLPVVGAMMPFGSLDKIVRDLREFLPQFSKSLSAAEKSLSGYTPANHEKIIDSIDKTVLLLKVNADKLEDQIIVLRRTVYGFLGLCVLAALAHAGLAIAILLVIPSSEAPTPTRPRVVFK